MQQVSCPSHKHGGSVMSDQPEVKSAEDTEAAESKKKDATMDDSEAEKIVGGTASPRMEEWHNSLPRAPR